MPAALIIFFLIFKTPLKIGNYYFHYTDEKKITGSEGSWSFFKVTRPVVNLISSVFFKYFFYYVFAPSLPLLINGSFLLEHLAF